jgi:photosystem II stability/assembly factor-like uncharacterized protein
MSEMEVEQLVRDEVVTQRAAIEIPGDYSARVLRSIKSASNPSRGLRRGRDLMSAAAILALVAVLAGGIAWIRTHSRPVPGPVVTPAPTAAGQPGALTYPGQPMRFVTAQVGWRVVPQHLYRTPDGGRSWQTVLTIQTGALAASASWFFDDRRAVAVSAGSSGYRLYRTIDAGATWQEAALPSATFPVTVSSQASFISPTDGWILSGDGPDPSSLANVRLYRTTDGGLHWSEANHSTKQTTSGSIPLTGVLDHLTFRDASSGWITARESSGPAVYATTDGGRTWHGQKLPPAPGYDLKGAYPLAPLFPSGSLEGLLPVQVWLPLPPGSPGRSTYSRMILYRSQDGGRTWSSPVVLPATSPTDSGVSGGFLGSYWWLAAWREIWVSQDAGRTWSHLQPHLAQDERITNVGFADSMHAYGQLIAGPATAALEHVSDIESTDGGLTWHPVQLPG